MSLTIANACGAILAATLRVVIIVFRAGDGRMSVMPTSNMTVPRTALSPKSTPSREGAVPAGSCDRGRDRSRAAGKTTRPYPAG
ncbi:hypothetical protein [Brucella intermedia]|uniref:hypothetical protein n=1 Tax=Brucella intermedia TaxID=94625 RepID=UPI00224A9282|nr:hypothetical protein [Brucella intermedia]